MSQTNPTLTIRKSAFSWFPRLLNYLRIEEWVLVLGAAAGIISSYYSYIHRYTISYGDAESHLNIAKRVVDSLTPGFAQLGGIWLPLPHLLLIPFVYFNPLWRTGLAGSIVSGIAFIITALYIYKLGHLLTRTKSAAFFGAMVFILNPNILYLQSTPMTELVLIVFFMLSSYFFIRFLLDDTKLLMLIAAAGFGFCASLSRYDGWALVTMEAGVLFLYYFPWQVRFAALRDGGKLFVQNSNKAISARINTLEGRIILFATLAFFGIFLWLMWSYLILGDPLYFTHSQFSANSQQKSWLARGELPAYHSVVTSFLYYFITSLSIGGILVSLMSLAGMAYFAFAKTIRHRAYIMLVLLVPFFFNVLTLYVGQSVIFIPSLTPSTFEWNLFNVRYGVMMMPVIALFAGFLFSRISSIGRVFVVSLVAMQCVLFLIGFAPVLTLDDGLTGLSSATAKIADAQFWLAANYDHGMVLADDYARTISIIRTSIPMNQVIYIGNKPYWQESLVEPEKYARWIVMQKDDTLWKSINEDPVVNARLYKYFNKVYTSDTILIFRKIDDSATVQ